MASFCEQLGLILRRNYLIKTRALRDTAAEFLFPMLFLCILLILKSSLPDTQKDQVRYQQPVNPLDLSLFTQSRTLVYTPGRANMSTGTNNPVAVPEVDPRGLTVENIMDYIRKSMPEAQIGNIIGFATAEELLAYRSQHLNNADDNKPATNGSVFAALFFTNTTALPDLINPLALQYFVPDAVQYTLRVPGGDLPDTGTPWQTYDYEENTDALDYSTSGFTAVQTAVGQALLTLRAIQLANLTQSGHANVHAGDPPPPPPVSPLAPANASVSSGLLPITVLPTLQLFPTRAYFIDNFHDTLVSIGPMYFVIGFFAIIQKLLQNLVLEKERRTKEGMKMMGLRGSVLSLGWYLTYVVVTTIPCALITILSSAFKFYSYTPGMTIFVLVFLYLQSLIALSFLFALFFDQSKTAGQAGGLLTFMLYLPYYALSSASSGVIGFACLSSPIAFAQGFAAIADGEAAQNGVTLFGNMKGGSSTTFGYGSSLVMLLIDSGLYSILAWYISNVLPGEYGTTRPWYFLFQASYWCPARERSRDVGMALLKNHQEGSEDTATEPVPKSLADKEVVRISALRKVFDPRLPCCRSKEAVKAKGGAGAVVAVDSVSLSMYEGQILALLGHNGAGKSTTIGMLTGLFESTSGEVSMYGKSLFSNLDETRRLFGVCPQHDILFDQLTVKEHLEFYAGLKGVARAQRDEAIREIIAELGLDDKTNARSVTLSGGQKRKLSVAIALIGNSRIIFLDEPTSGMDPFSRRRVWALLQKYKSGRVIVLTTHFMDEADLLGDRIAILSKGRLRCVGSSLFLKARFGIGYHLDMVPGPNCDKPAVTQLVTSAIPGARLQTSGAASELGYVMPLQQMKQFAALFEQLEARSQALGVLSYGISLTTLEEVFLNLAHDHDEEKAKAEAEEERNAENADAPSSSSTANGAHSTTERTALMNASDAKRSDLDGGDEQDQDEEPESKDFQNVSINLPKRKVSGMNERWTSTASGQFRAMISKRIIVAKRSKRGLFFQFVFPLIYVLLFLIISMQFGNPNDTQYPPLIQLSAPSAYSGTNAPVIAMDNATTQGVIVANLGRTDFVPFAPVAVANNSLEGLLDALLSPSLPTTYGALSVTGLPLWARVLWSPAPAPAAAPIIGQPLTESDDGPLPPTPPNSEGESGFNATPIAVTLLCNSSALHAFPVLMDWVVNAVLQNFPNPNPNSHGPAPPKYSVQTSNWPFEYNSEFSAVTVTGVLQAVFVGLAFAYIPITYAVSLVKEKEAGAKHQQIVMGVRPLMFWSANFVFDYICFLVPVILAFIMFAAFNSQILLGPRLPAAVALFVLYGMACVPFAYLLSFVFKKEVSTQSTLVMLFGFGTMILYFLSFAIRHYLIGKVLIRLFAISPQFCFSWSLFLLSMAQANHDRCVSIPGCVPETAADMFSISDYIGGYLLMLIGMSVLCFWLTYMLENGSFLKCCTKPTTAAVNARGMDDDEQEESEVAAERERVARTEDDPVRMLDLRRVFTGTSGFGDNKKETTKVAVSRMTLGIPQGECFGLLGPNGAGKTTTMAMLTGDVTVTGGDAWLCRASIIPGSTPQGWGYIFSNLGFCPQFDGLLESMTGREHLRMYASIKGVPLAQRERLVNKYLATLHLTEHADKLSSKYSGGNKRKLSLAVALIGNPRVMLLDEPSTGMDPQARRGMWDVISSEMSQRSVILTTHSMEEADALCTRIGIMVNGHLKCLGSSQHLKSKYGAGYQLEIKTNDQPEDVARVKTLVDQLIPKSEDVKLLEDFGGKLRYSVPVKAVTLSKLFGEVERVRAEYAIQDYSISQTTLEQVFISFAKKQEDAGSN